MLTLHPPSDPPSPANARRRYLTAVQVMARYSVSPITLFRWVRDEARAFPQPVVINRRRYFDIDLLNAYDKRNGASSNVLRDRVQQAAAGGEPLTAVELVQVAALIGGEAA